MKIRGIVKRNIGRGKRLGFPTANLDAPADFDDGIYFALVRIQDQEKKLLGLAFVGKAETFADQERNLEVYLLDFDKDLYGQEIEIELLKKSRDNRKFDSEEDLVAQMKQDESDARKFFLSYGRTE